MFIMLFCIIKAIIQYYKNNTIREPLTIYYELLKYKYKYTFIIE